MEIPLSHSKEHDFQAISTEQLFALPPLGLLHLRNVNLPTLKVFRPAPETAIGLGMIICPGGGFTMLSIANEGEDMARWLATRGLVAAVLKYRVSPTSREDPEFFAEMLALMKSPQTAAEVSAQQLPLAVADGQKALELMRTQASQWNLAPENIGLLGFSAGAKVAGQVALLQRDLPVFCLGGVYGAPRLIEKVPEHAPPLFLALALDDSLGTRVVDTSLEMYMAWQAVGRPAELHAYMRGGHGFGMRRQNLPSDGWAERFYEWLITLQHKL